MNGYEIADELEMVMDGYAIAITASGMLRQQQAEIEALKAKLSKHDSQIKRNIDKHEFTADEYEQARCDYLNGNQ
jgi:hypothetical protein